MLLLPQENDIAKTVAAYAGLKQWGTLQVIHVFTARAFLRFFSGEANMKRHFTMTYAEKKHWTRYNVSKYTLFGGGEGSFLAF